MSTSRSGLLTTIGLSAKNAILIVEFADEPSTRPGASLVEAAMEAARLRLRPILMTSLAFILGVLPLALARGAGAGSQNAIGTGVVGGMSRPPCWPSSSCRCSSWWWSASPATARGSAHATPQDAKGGDHA